jgi:signal transduction histidine kinase
VRRRVLVTIVAVTVVAVLAFFVPAALAIRSRIQRGDLLELQREASIVASRIPASGRVDTTVLGDTIGAGHEVAFYDGSGNLVEGQGPPATDEFVATALRGRFAEGYEHGDLVAAVPLRPGSDGPSLVVRIEEPGERSLARIGRSIALLGAAAVGVLLVAASIGVLLARRLSRPVEDLRQWAATLGQHDHPPPPAAGIAELDELAAAMSASSERVRQLLQRERSFSSHVSHQLRTPVAAMRVAVETELDAPRPDPSEVLRECLRELDRLERTVTSLLALARHDERQPEWCDVAGLVRAQAERWRAPYAAAGRTVDCRGTSVWAGVDTAAVIHIVDVLLDNALIHGRGTVTVATESTPQTIRIDVGDEGTPPVDADPFSDRRIETRHGIGLRLARTLAESQGGELGLVERPTTVFRLVLPDADHPVHRALT